MNTHLIGCIDQMGRVEHICIEEKETFGNIEIKTSTTFFLDFKVPSSLMHCSSQTMGVHRIDAPGPPYFGWSHIKGNKNNLPHKRGLNF